MANIYDFLDYNGEIYDINVGYFYVWMDPEHNNHNVQELDINCQVVNRPYTISKNDYNEIKKMYVLIEKNTIDNSTSNSISLSKSMSNSDRLIKGKPKDIRKKYFVTVLKWIVVLPWAMLACLIVHLISKFLTFAEHNWWNDGNNESLSYLFTLYVQEPIIGGFASMATFVIAGSSIAPK